MPRAAAPKKATAAKPRKPKAKKATAKKVAAPRRRVTLQPSSGETLKQNATQLEVAERMLAELASREQAETDPAVAAQRALRAAIASGAIPAGATILKSAPKMPSQNDMDAQARLDAQKAVAKAARDTAKAQANAREFEAMLRRIGGPAPPAIALGAPVMGGPFPAPAPPPMPPPIMPPTGPPLTSTRRPPPPPPPPPRVGPVTPAREVVTANALAAALSRLAKTPQPAAVARTGPDPASLAAQAAKMAAKFGKQEDRAAKIDAQRAARQAAQQEASSQQRILENELVAAVARREDARALARAREIAQQDEAADAAEAAELARARTPRPLALPVESPAAPEEAMASIQRIREGAQSLGNIAADTERQRQQMLEDVARRYPVSVDAPRPPRVVTFGTQTGETGSRPVLGDNIIVYNQAGDAISSYKYDSAPLRDRIARGDIYQDAETGQYVWSAGAIIPPQTRLRPVNNPAQSVVDIVSRELEGAGLYGYGDTPPRPKTSASKSGRRVIPGYSHTDTLSALRTMITKVNEEADIAERAAQRERERIAALRAYQPKTSATIATQTDPMVPTMTVFNSRTMQPYTVSMATYQKNYNAGNIEMDESGRPIFVVKAHRDANKMIADQEMNDYINELIAEMPDTEGSGRGGETHAVGFPSDEWTPAQARKWVKDHGGKPIKPMRREGSWLRFRMTPPDRYSRFATKTLKSNGRTVHLVIGWR